MTRDEAQQIIERGLDDPSRERWLNVFVGLGMLKLDEPAETATVKLATALGWPAHGRSHGELITALALSGLDLVERR